MLLTEEISLFYYWNRYNVIGTQQKRVRKLVEPGGTTQPPHMKHLKHDQLSQHWAPLYSKSFSLNVT